MDAETLNDVTNALDLAVASVVKAEFQRLATAVGPEQTARNVLRSLRSFESLQQGIMPAYDEWDAVFYATWYHPGHVNLAYTLIEKIPAPHNPLKSGKGSLHVRDFGCGTLAMQFGLALAAADSVAQLRTFPRVNIFSEDSSRPMVAIGRRIWSAFIGEIASRRKYPTLNALRRVCRSMTFEAQRKDADTSWLSALHVAYEGNAPQVKSALADRIRQERPDLVIVTSHPRNALYAFRPQSYEYSDESQTFQGAEFSLKGDFSRISEFRSQVYDRSEGQLQLLSDDADRFVRNYLKRYPTSWITLSLGTKDFLYIRNQEDDLDDLPF